MDSSSIGHPGRRRSCIPVPVRGGRQRDLHVQSAGRPGVGLGVATMRMGDRCHDGKAEAGAVLVVMPVVRLVPGRESWRLLPRYAIAFLDMPCRSTSVIRSLSASIVKP